MTTPLIVVGAGGFGREVLDVVEAMNSAADEPVFDVLGVVDDFPTDVNRDRLAQRGYQYLGVVDDWLATGRTAEYLIGIGWPQGRAAVAAKFEAAGAVGAIAIHPSATLGSRVQISPGTVVCAGVRITTNIAIGQHVHLNLNVTVGHDTTLGDYVSVNPLVAISGDCAIGNRVMLGTGSVVLQKITIGADAVVGGSACVVRDVADGLTVKGIPAR